MNRHHILVPILLAALGVAACSDQTITDPAAREASGLLARRVGDGGGSGALYTETNAAAGNAIVSFTRAPDGTLTPAGTIATGGTGAGVNLASQGAIVLSADGGRLFAVNAGSNDVSVFAVGPQGLTLTDRFASGGTMPISLTLHDDLLYVLNAGGRGGIHGFTMSEKGVATPAPGSRRSLSDSGVGPAEVEFSDDGRWLAVTEKNTNLIDLYSVDETGIASGPTPHASAGTTPFGFSFGGRSELFVSEAAGTASSYRLGGEGSLTAISAAVATYHAAPCWLVVTGNARFAYTANAHDGTISGFSVSPQGDLVLLNADGTTATPGAGNLDLALSGDGRYLYQLRSGGPVTGYRIGATGQLTLINAAGSMPAAVTGLAAR